MRQKMGLQPGAPLFLEEALSDELRFGSSFSLPHVCRLTNHFHLPRND